MNITNLKSYPIQTFVHICNASRELPYEPKVRIPRCDRPKYPKIKKEKIQKLQLYKKSKKTPKQVDVVSTPTNIKYIACQKDRSTHPFIQKCIPVKKVFVESDLPKDELPTHKHKLAIIQGMDLEFY